jgi:dynein intermediate chain
MVYLPQQDTEVPTASAVVEGAPALNRVSWTPSGLHVTVGDDTGKIWVYDVGEVSYARCRKRTKFQSVGHDYQLSCYSQSVLWDPGCKLCH